MIFLFGILSLFLSSSHFRWSAVLEEENPEVSRMMRGAKRRRVEKRIWKNLEKSTWRNLEALASDQTVEGEQASKKWRPMG